MSLNHLYVPSNYYLTVFIPNKTIIHFSVCGCGGYCLAPLQPGKYRPSPVISIAENSLYLFLLPPEFDLFLYLTEPGAPRNFKAVAISPNRINLTWVKPSQSGGIVTGYIINQVQDHNLHNIIYC